MVDYSDAEDMLLPTSYSFNSCDPLSIVVHETGGNMTLDSVYQTFLNTMRSTHFAIDRDGNVAQFVPLVRGAGGNCCPDKDAAGNLLCDSYWYGFVQRYGNLNLCTISIEHCNNETNTLPMTQAQTDASNKLILWLCQQFNLNLNHIKGHNSINPVNKPDCPGTFSFSQLASFLAGQERNPHMDTQAQDVWNMFLKGIGQTPVSYVTGIAQSWQQNYLHLNAGSPLGPEGSTVNWEGVPIQMQYFSGGIRAEYNTVDHVVRWYDAYHRQVA